jgi:hypothetical protein
MFEMICRRHGIRSITWAHSSTIMETQPPPGEKIHEGCVFCVIMMLRTLAISPAACGIANLDVLQPAAPITRD